MYIVFNTVVLSSQQYRSEVKGPSQENSLFRQKFLFNFGSVKVGKVLIRAHTVQTDISQTNTSETPLLIG